MAEIWPAVLIVLVVAAIGGGLIGSLPGVAPATYTFEPRVGLHDGRYQGVAETASLDYLEACKPMPHDVVGVRRDLVITVRPGRGNAVPPSLWQILFDGRQLALGLRRC